MGALLGVVFLLACAYVLGRSVSGAAATARPGRRAARGGGSSRSALRSPGTRGAARAAGRSAMNAAAHPSNSQVRTQARADIRRMREEFRLKGLDAQREHDRQNGGGGAGAPAAARPTIRQRLRLAPFDPADPGPPGNGGQPADDTSRPAAPGNGGPPARQVPQPPAQAPQPSPDGGSPVPGTPSGAPAEKMIEGIEEIRAHAASGGLRAKQEAVRAAHEGALRFAQMCQMLARTMSEPNSHYGPEITEPIEKAGQHFQAGAMSLSEADSNLDTLANMTLREASVSPRQVPHHEHELSESGRH